MSNVNLTSSFTFSMPPATVTSLIPKSLCRKVASPARAEHVPGDEHLRHHRMAAGDAVQRQIPVQGDLVPALTVRRDVVFGPGLA